MSTVCSLFVFTASSPASDWLHAKQITHLALVILAKDDGRTLERWTFDVKDSKSPILQPPLISSTKTPSKDTTQDLATLNVLKQIIAATTMLPDLPAPAVFTLQAYVADEEESHTLSGEWKEVNSLPFDKDTEVQHTQLRGVKMEGKEVGVWLTSMDD